MNVLGLLSHLVSPVNAIVIGQTKECNHGDSIGCSLPFLAFLLIGHVLFSSGFVGIFHLVPIFAAMTPLLPVFLLLFLRVVVMLDMIGAPAIFLLLFELIQLVIIAIDSIF